jgi:hypothetical protein
MRDSGWRARLWQNRHRIGVAVLLTVIVGAHAALWASPHVPAETRARLTLLNAAGWGVVLLPAIGVALWARAHRRRPPP